MTSDGPALLAAILANPDEDAPRLVYADWLEENGQAERAEFIRVQCEIARKVAAEPQGKESAWLAGYRLAQHREESVMTALVGDGVCRCVLCLGKRDLALLQGGEAWHESADAHWSQPLPQHWKWVWSRGFISEVECAAADWLTHADASRAVHPVRKVTLTTWPTLVFLLDLPADGRPGPARGFYLDKRQTLHPVGIRIEDALRAEWPEIEFQLPAEMSITWSELPAEALLVSNGIDISGDIQFGFANHT